MVNNTRLSPLISLHTVAINYGIEDFEKYLSVCHFTKAGSSNSIPISFYFWISKMTYEVMFQWR